MLRGVRLRKVGHVDEGVVEGGEDTGNAKDELAWDTLSVTGVSLLEPVSVDCHHLPSRAWGPNWTFSCFGAGAFLGAIFCC